MGIQKSTTEYNGEVENENWVSWRKEIVAEEELEVGLWRLSVWLEVLVTVRLF
jgi:hypothetical protein